MGFQIPPRPNLTSEMIKKMVVLSVRDWSILLLIFSVINLADGQVAQQFVLDGAITIGESNSNSPLAGTIRWNESTQDFEGYDGTTWHSLTSNQNGLVFPPLSTDQVLTMVPADRGARAGYAVAIDGPFAFIGAPNSNNSAGRVQVLERTDSNRWSVVQTLTASDGASYDGFGSAIAVSGNNLVIGAYIDAQNPSNNENNDGKVYFFRYNGSEWNEIRTYTSEDILFDRSLGQSVDIHQDIAVVSDPGYDFTLNDAGRIFIFQYNGTTWQQVMSFEDDDPQTGAMFGSSIAFDGDLLVVGVPGHDQGSSVNNGKVVIYERMGSLWSFNTEVYSPDAAQFESFGYDVSVDNNRVVIGAPGATIGNQQFSGATYFFHFNGSAWTEAGKVQLGPPEALAAFGSSVKLLKDQVYISALQGAAGNHDDQGLVHQYFFNGSDWKFNREINDLTDQDLGKFGWDIDLG